MPIPTEPDGPPPRPAGLQKASEDLDARRTPHQELLKEHDEACRDSTERVEAVGSPGACGETAARARGVVTAAAQLNV